MGAASKPTKIAPALAYRRWLTTVRFDHGAQQLQIMRRESRAFISRQLTVAAQDETPVCSTQPPHESLLNPPQAPRPALGITRFTRSDRRMRRIDEPSGAAFQICCPNSCSAMSAPANSKFVWRWRIVEADFWDIDHFDLRRPARERSAQRDAAKSRRTAIDFNWIGFDEGDNVSGGLSRIVGDGSIENYSVYREGDEACPKPNAEKISQIMP